jgi:hypothetical protein
MDMDQLLVDLSKKLTDEGKIIEAGWVGLRLAALNPRLSPEQLAEMRMVFMAGAAHLFATINTVMDPGDELSERDLRRMDMVAEELHAFGQEVRLRIAGTKGSA